VAVLAYLDLLSWLRVEPTGVGLVGTAVALTLARQNAQPARSQRLRFPSNEKCVCSGNSLYRFQLSISITVEVCLTIELGTTLFAAATQEQWRGESL